LLPILDLGAKIDVLRIRMNSWQSAQAQFRWQKRNGAERDKMKIINRAKEIAATGYILLWLLGIPIPILLLIFLLRGCT
jgi:hypothetical protein